MFISRRKSGVACVWASDVITFGGSHPGVVEGALLGLAEVDRQQRLGAVQRLDPRLRVHRHDRLPLRGVQVETDDVADLLLKRGSSEILNVPGPSSQRASSGPPEPSVR